MKVRLTRAFTAISFFLGTSFAAASVIPSVTLDIRTCDKLLGQILTGFRPPQVFEFQIGQTTGLPTLQVTAPTQAWRRFYFEHSNTPQYFTEIYQNSVPTRVVFETLPLFLKGMQKNRAYNFIWLKSGRLRFANSGTVLFQILASKHIVLASIDDEEVVVAGEIIIEDDGGLALNGRSGTFPEESDVGIQRLASALREDGNIRVHVTHWNAQKLLSQQVAAADNLSFTPTTSTAQIDHEGEIGLLKLLHVYRDKYFRKKSGAAIYSEGRAGRPYYRMRSLYTISKQPLAQMENLSEQFAEVIRKHSELTPFLGDEPAWSYEARRFVKKKGYGITLSKLLAALIISRGREFIPTGLELALEQAVQNYQGPRLWPSQLFEMSYVLAAGDIFKALLTCHNVLSTDSRLVNRQETGIHPKLAYIRADSQPLGDNFGAWYHLFGMASFSIKRRCSFASLVATAETLSSRAFAAPDYQEELMNKMGVRLGQDLKNEFVENDRLAGSVNALNSCD